MFGIGSTQRPGRAPGQLAATLALGAALVGTQALLLVALVGRPLERAVTALREPPPATILVRVPEYAEEIEIVGPPGWERELLRRGAARRAALPWLAGVRSEAAPLLCPVGE